MTCRSGSRAERRREDKLTRIPSPHACVLGAAPVSRRTRDTQKKYPVKKILMSKANVADAFRNVRVDPDEAHNFATQ